MLIIGKIFERMKVVSSQYTTTSSWVLPFTLNSVNTIIQMSPISHPVEKQQEKWCRVVVGQEDAPCLSLHLCHIFTLGCLEDSGSLNPYFLCSVFTYFPGFPAVLRLQCCCPALLHQHKEFPVQG